MAIGLPWDIMGPRANLGDGISLAESAMKKQIGPKKLKANQSELGQESPRTMGCFETQVMATASLQLSQIHIFLGWKIQCSTGIKCREDEFKIIFNGTHC